jgi:Caspase domain
MNSWTPADRSRSRAVLVGTSRYAHLKPVPAAANSLDRMRKLLQGPLCAWPADRITLIAEQRLPADLPDHLIELYEQAADVALFYYVGHGQIDDEGQLCLGLADSRIQAERRASTSLTFDAVRKALRASPAAVKVVILDCCFAGQAVHGHNVLAGPELDVTALTSAAGAYTLAATGPFSTAWFEPETDSPAPQTYFTKYLADLVERGIPGAPTILTLDPIYQRLRHDLPAAGKPAPTRSSRDSADAFIFARNAAPRAPQPSPAADADQHGDLARRYRLLDDAEQAADSIRDQVSKIRALARIAVEAVADDPDRSRRLLDDTERLARGVTDAFEKSCVWGEVVGIWAAARKTLLADVPDRARKLLDDAEQVARQGLDGDRYTRHNMEYLLAAIAKARYAYDPASGEQTARSIPDAAKAGSALHGLACDVAARDPDGAERIARAISDLDWKMFALTDVAAEMMKYDPGRGRQLFAEAEHIALSIRDVKARNGSLVKVAGALARSDPANSLGLRSEAERISGEIDDPREQASAAELVARAIIAVAPGHAHQLLKKADYLLNRKLKDQERRNAEALRANIAGTMASVNPDDAASIARDLTEQADTDYVLGRVVQAIALSHPDRAEGFAHRIAEPGSRAVALATAAKAVTASDPNGAASILESAERIVRAITVTQSDFVSLAKIVASYDPDHAEAMVRDGISEEERRDAALAEIAKVIAGDDPDRAETIARGLSDPESKSQLLVALAARHAGAGQAIQPG